MVPDGPPEENSGFCWSGRVRSDGKADKHKDFHALLGDIFGMENIELGKGMRSVEGEAHPQAIQTLQINDVAFDRLSITPEQFVSRLNAFGSQEDTPLAMMAYIEGIPFALVIDADAAQVALDKRQKSPDGDTLLPQQASLRGFLETLILQRSHEQSGDVTPIRGFTR